MAWVRKPLPKNKPIRVGITGGIGSGKSVVAKVFSVLGIPVFDSDRVAKEILATNSTVIASVTKHFGQEAYLDGIPNRAFLAKSVFSDSSKRELLNSIIHPEVGRSFERFCHDYEAKPYIVKEAAIMIETGILQHLDIIVLVSAPMETRIQRVLNRDKTSRDAVEGRMSAQLSDEEKRKHAHFEIVNDDKNPVIPKVLQIHHTILRSAWKGNLIFATSNLDTWINSSPL